MNLRALRQQLKHNMAVKLLAADYSALNIHANKTTRTRAKPPIYAPENTVTRREHLVVGIAAWQPQAAGDTHRRMPPEARAIGMQMALVAHGAPPPNSTDYQHLPESTRARFNLTFESGQVGMDCYLVTL